MAKHATGITPWAIGIEHVGTNARQIMSNRQERRASFRLTCWLRQRLRIPLRGVIGHGEIRSNPRFGLTPAGWHWVKRTGYKFHKDFSHRSMRTYRAWFQKVCD
jgi:hypothetical protein